MIGGEQSVDLDVGADRLWAYMSAYENWAEYVIGFQELKVVDEKRTVWTLRGDVGILSRAVDIQVDLVERVDGEIARFELTGLTERLSGSGSFRVETLNNEPSDDGGSSPAAGLTTAAAAADPVAARPSRWQRFWFRVISRLIGRKRPQPPQPSKPTATPSAQAQTSGERSRLTFTLQVSPGGPMAPMVEMLMAPLLQPAADDICARIRHALGGTYADH